MRAAKFLSAILLFLISFTISAQEYNPFKSIGKKAKILTLSKGKYVEFFDYDTIQRIGTVLINIRTKKIVKLLDAEQTFKKFSDNSGTSRWYSPDPLADKFASLSPYNFVENNPINMIDPDGREAKDWYKDKKGVMQFDPTVKNQGDLEKKNISGTYVGETKTETSSRNAKVEYRKDGSILFNNENDAYDRMKTIGVTREALAVNTGKQTLYLPDYKNNYSTSEHESLGYIFKGSKIFDPVSGTNKSLSFSIHTHLSLFNGRPWGDDNPSFDDKYTYGRLTPNIPFITIGAKNIWGGLASWKPREDGTYNRNDLKWTTFLTIPQTQLYNGLKNIISQKRSTYGNY